VKSGSATTTAPICKQNGHVEKERTKLPGLRSLRHQLTGEYLFRTIKPVPYPGRTPHIHYKVKLGGKGTARHPMLHQRPSGHPKDGIWKSLKEGKGTYSVTVDFIPLRGAKAGELAAKFDLVLGVRRPLKNQNSLNSRFPRARSSLRVDRRARKAAAKAIVDCRTFSKLYPPYLNLASTLS